MDIYTKKGDKGQTSLYGGTRVNKDSLRVEAYGTVDEANSVIGLVYVSTEFEDFKQVLRQIQRKMFVVGSQLASDEAGNAKLKVKIETSDIVYLENVIDHYSADVGVINSFTLPGETKNSAIFHLARTVVRRAERLCVSLSKDEFVCPLIIKYLNRLSDAMFMMARADVKKTFVQKVVEGVLAKVNENATISTVLQHSSEGVLTDCVCRLMANSAKEESEKLGVGVTFSVADCSGNLIYLEKFNDAILASVNISQNKAYTAAAFKAPTGELAISTKSGDSLYGLNTIDNRIVVFGGGFPLFINGELVGAIGVSGGSVQEDEQIAQKALDVFSNSIA